MNKVIIAFLITFIGCKTSQYSIRIGKYKFNDHNPNKVVVKESDTLNVFFDSGFSNDTVLLNSDYGILCGEILTSDDLFAFAKKVNIPKNKIGKRIYIVVNGIEIGSFKIDKRYSEVHVNFDKKRKILKWEYHKYRFVYI